MDPLSPSPEARARPGKRRIEACFSAKAGRYDDAAVLQEKAGRRLATLIEGQGGLRFPCADLGCGTGRFHRGGGAGLLAGVDLSRGMLERFRRAVEGSRAVRGDVERLPLRTGCLGMALLSWVLQWTECPREVVEEAARCLRPGGWMGFSVLLRGTLEEFYALLRQWGRGIPVLLPEKGEFETWLGAAGLEVAAKLVSEEVQHFAGAREALKSLSITGAGASGAPLLRRSEVDSFCREYERRFGSPGGVPLRWVVLTGLARKRA